MSTYTAILDLVINPSENGAVITAETYPGLSDPTNYNVLSNFNGLLSFFFGNYLSYFGKFGKLN